MSSDGLDLTRRDALKAGGVAAAALGIGGSASFLQEADAQSGELEYEQVPTACWIGKQDCAAVAKKVGNRVIKYEGHPDERRTGGGLCPKGQAQIAQVYDPHRIKAPLKRTNGKGQHGEWEEISWEQAMDEIGDDLTTKLEDDPRRVVFQVGRKKSPQWQEDAWVTGTSNKYGSMEKYGHGATCSDSGYRAQELIFGTHGVSETDFENCDYFLAWGFGATTSGGAHTCNITWTREVADAKEGGMHTVTLDPQTRGMGSYTDEWVPIEPGTDMAFFNAMNHVLVREGYVDEEYLIRATNAPCLVATEGDQEGHILRTDAAEDPGEAWKWPDGELVYDEAVEEPVPHEEADDPALRGAYTVDGVEAKPAFQLFVEHLDQYDPEWGEEITGIDADTIERIAIEWGEHAKIGATVEVNGEEVPYRPVGMHGYHVAQQEMGTVTTMAHYQTAMLVGAIDAVGSTRVRKGKYSEPNDGYLPGFRDLAYHPEKITPNPDGPDLGESMFHPISSGGYTQTWVSLNDPEKYNLPHEPSEMAMIVQMANPALSAPQTDTVVEALSKLDTTIVVDPFMSETADVAADYVLPAATADKLQGPTGGWNGTGEIEHIRFPSMDPLFDSKPDAEIFIQLAKAVDAYEEYVADINAELGLDGTEYAYSGTDEAPDDPHEFLRDGLDRWARTKGKSLEWFREGNVINTEWEVGGGNRYAYTWGSDNGYGEYNPYDVKHDLYSETLVRMGDRVDELMAQEGFDESDFPYIQDYNGFPTWREPTAFKSPDEYDLTTYTFHQIEHKQSRTANNKLLNEIAPESPIRISAQDAERLGIENGQEVVIETHNAMTGETYRGRGNAMVLEGVTPGTVGLPPHHGSWKDPESEALDEGPNVNKLFPSGPGYVGLDNGQAFQIRAKVEHAGGDD
ncbi:molybdopterin-dependent oxidoreductase [Halorubrum sp. F4]|uniref:molybdopterin-containing oxidoreductase family protein n=1 Tax=Halorubrum sp. F4 TaxID=2989715 RepID=UPI0024812899|nr:molybdopterin-dependent oxidoreductase [Halorubrum sp. F4]